MADTTAATTTGVPDPTMFGDPRLARLYTDVLQSESYLSDFIQEWKVNVDYRMNRPYATTSETDRTAVPWDWSMTKTKHGQLFSDTPQVRLGVCHPKFKPTVGVMQRKTNALVKSAKVRVAMDEAIPDVINAAGIGIVFVGQESRQMQRSVPKQDPLLAQLQPPAPPAAPMSPQAPPPMMGEPVEGAEGAPAAPPVPEQPLQPEMVTANYSIDSGKRYFAVRISPADFRFPSDFAGSDFDDASWLGHRGRKTWSDAKASFNLTDEDKVKVLGASKKRNDQQLAPDEQKNREDIEPMVSYYEAFYWRYLYHVDEPSFHAIQHVVFVDGINDRAVKDEEWKGQRRGENNSIIGPCKFPLRVETFEYVSDEALPPSDTCVGRSMVDFLNRSHTNQLIQQMASLPMRWADTNRIDTLVLQHMLRGTWQAIIPVNGDGSRAMGEVTRANYPDDHFRFDDIARNYLYEATGVNPNSLGTRGGPAIRSAEEAHNVQQNMQTQVGSDRAKTVSFFCGIAEVLLGLASALDDFTDEERKELQQFDASTLSGSYTYEVRADSSVLLDATQRYQRLKEFLNDTVKSGFINPKPVLVEMALLAGVEPEESVIDPQKPPQEQANISIRTDSEGLKDPVTLAFLMKTGQAPTREELEAAKELLLTVQTPPASMTGAPPMPVQPEEPGMPKEDAHPDWDEASRINKRTGDGQ